MNEELLQHKFEDMGARLTIRYDSNLRWPAAVDIVTRGRGETFEITARPGARLEVVDLRPRDRHLLLMLRDGDGKHKYLCGHDERHWFAAAIPETARGVATVRTAFEALRPPEVQEAVSQRPLRRQDRYRRHNEAFLRQGEWFFVPCPEVRPPAEIVLRDEPLTRDLGSKPHLLEFCFRRGGETVYVSTGFGGHPSLLARAAYNETELQQLFDEHPRARRWRWRPAKRNPELYARGRVTHADHATIVLRGWHRVFMNTENKAEGRRHLQFVD